MIQNYLSLLWQSQVAVSIVKKLSDCSKILMMLGGEKTVFFKEQNPTMIIGKVIFEIILSCMGILDLHRVQV